jgi:hypothetical protein
MKTKTIRLCVTVDAAFDEGDDAITNKAIKDACDGENLDISDVPVIVHDVTEPECKGRKWFMQANYEMVVEAESEEEAVEQVEENINWYCDGWTVDQIAVRVIDTKA